MRLLTYRIQSGGSARLGVTVGPLLADVARLGSAHGAALPADMLTFIDESATVLPCWRTSCPQETACLRELPSRSRTPGSWRPLSGHEKHFWHRPQLSGPCGRVRADVEYRPGHSQEPGHFLQTAHRGHWAGRIRQHNAALTQQLDWEVELAAVVGKTATRIRREDALSHVFGYSVMIDISARDNRRGGQWIFSKGMDTYAPFGPCIVTADEIPTPQDLRLCVEEERGDKAGLEYRQHDLFR